MADLPPGRAKAAPHLAGRRVAPGGASVAAGLPLAHPLGLAAGYDRDGSRIAAIVAAGFAFAEFGTVTPHPEPDHNRGADALAAALARARRRGSLDALCVGVNLGANFDTPQRRVADDWVGAMGKLAPVADYLAINLSAPYYRHLLAPHHGALLRRSLAVLAAAAPPSLRLLVKLPIGAPGLAPDGLIRDIAGLGLHGVIASIPVEAHPHAHTLLSALRTRLAGLALFAVGGIRHPADARARLAAGCDALQVYSAFADAGADAVRTLVSGLDP